MYLHRACEGPLPAQGAATPPATGAAAGPEDEALFAIPAPVGAAVRFAPNAAIFAEGDPADFLYQVIRGAVRSTKVLRDGRRQIGAFYLPGEAFGFQSGPAHNVAAEAIVDSQVLIARRAAVFRLAECNKEFAHRLVALSARELRRAQNLALTLGQCSARERVAAFLLDMAARSGRCATVTFPMSRRDIADHLGLTVETVSRMLGQLESDRVIALVNPREIRITDAAALRRASGV